MSEFSAAIAVVIAVGIAGVLVPVLPGALLVLAAVSAWAFTVGGVRAWAVVAAAAACLVGSQLLKYLVPGRRLRDAGVPRSALVVGAVLGIVGFFLIPIVGLFVGFVAGVYAVERRRLGSHSEARAATSGAVRAVGLSVVIELTGALLAAAIWLVGAVVLT